MPTAEHSVVNLEHMSLLSITLSRFGCAETAINGSTETARYTGQSRP